MGLLPILLIVLLVVLLAVVLLVILSKKKVPVLFVAGFSSPVTMTAIWEARRPLMGQKER